MSGMTMNNWTLVQIFIIIIMFGILIAVNYFFHTDILTWLMAGLGCSWLGILITNWLINRSD
jgi:hypothetical protein